MATQMTGGPKKPWDGDDPCKPVRALAGIVLPFIPVAALLALHALAGLARFQTP